MTIRALAAVLTICAATMHAWANSPPPPRLHLGLTVDGKILVNDMPVAQTRANEILTRFHAQNPDETVVLDCEPATSAAVLLDTIELLRRTGVRELQIGTFNQGGTTTISRISLDPKAMLVETRPRGKLKDEPPITLMESGTPVEFVGRVSRVAPQAVVEQPPWSISFDEMQLAEGSVGETGLTIRIYDRGRVAFQSNTYYRISAKRYSFGYLIQSAERIEKSANNRGQRKFDPGRAKD